MNKQDELIKVLQEKISHVEKIAPDTTPVETHNALKGTAQALRNIDKFLTDIQQCDSFLTQLSKIHESCKSTVVANELSKLINKYK